MARKTFSPIPVSKKELAAALATEKHPGKRKRLLALQALLRGKTNAAAARYAKASPASVGRWLKRARKGGIDAVLSDRPRKAPMTQDVVAARAEIAAALQRNAYWKLQKRLRAIDAVLAGQSLDAAAALASVRVGMLRKWIKEIRERGISATLKKWEKPHKTRPRALDADPVVLRALARNEKNRHMRKRLLALAYLADGLSPDDAAVRAGMSGCTVREYRHRYQQGGIAAIRSKPCMGGTTKLKGQEIQAVASVVRQNPNISLAELRGRIKAEFGVRYTRAGLKNMLKKQLGIVHGAGASRHTQPLRSSQAET